MLKAGRDLSRGNESLLLSDDKPANVIAAKSISRRDDRFINVIGVVGNLPQLVAHFIQRGVFVDADIKLKPD